MIYRKKPVEIEAWEFTREALKSDDSWVRLYRNELHLISQYSGEVLYIEIDTLEGTMRANLGDFIIKGVQGEFYPCKSDIFEQTYEKVERRLNMFEFDEVIEFDEAKYEDNITRQLRKLKNDYNI